MKDAKIEKKTGAREDSPRPFVVHVTNKTYSLPFQVLRVGRIMLSIASLRQDGGTQPRASIQAAWIEEYARDMSAGAAFPPVTVFNDGTDYWLADGFHRTRAAATAGRTEIECDVRQGSQRDAVLFSVSANAAHGQRRTNDDKRRAVLCLLNDPEWSAKSNREIARLAAVDETLVRTLRLPAASAVKPQMGKPVTRTVTRGGVTFPMDTGNIGRRPAVDPEPTLPIKPAPKPFDRATAAIGSTAMEAIFTLASQPDPQTVIDALTEHASLDVPVETIERAVAWMSAFAKLYRPAAPAPRRNSPRG